MNIISVNESNIDEEHICCVISDKKGENCVSSKKAWMKERFRDGLILKKADVRGKVFIEYIPAEKAWSPINAENYMFINCLWVSGQYKGQGISNLLLQECIDDTKRQNKDGIIIVTSKKKMPFLSDPKYLKYKGFETCDTAHPYFELLCLSFNNDNKLPTFKDCAREGKIANKEGITLYYTNQCPYTEKYTSLLKDIADKKAIPFSLIKINALEEAQNAPTVWTTYSIFINGNFVTNEILTEKKFLKLIDENFK